MCSVSDKAFFYGPSIEQICGKGLYLQLGMESLLTYMCVHYLKYIYPYTVTFYLSTGDTFANV